ncbi:MAG: ROK family protein [Clostridia bacterium]|nr:ROK family protein [Clostridia bacterium]
MQHLGVEFSVKNLPVYDPGFIPIGRFNEAYARTADKPFGIALIRGENRAAVLHTRIHGDPEMRAADSLYLDRLLKSLLWMKGGYRVELAGDRALCETLISAYAPGGSRAFDHAFMTRVYERPFEVRHVDALPEEADDSLPIGRHLDGCRIGFDAGGSDRKVSAVIDGEPVYAEEVVWHPKTNADPQYHYEGIVSALKAAAAHLPRVDAIGVSSAGVFVHNRTMVASLFLKVPEKAFEEQVKDIYLRAAREIGDVPVVVCNDGDVTALAGAMSLNRNSVLGIAMGTSEAAGFVDRRGNITGWLNELAFAPVDLNPDAMADEWSGDCGVGCKYFSQDAVIKLAAAAGIPLSAGKTPAEKLKIVQGLAEESEPRALRVFADIGLYLAHTLPFYHRLYEFENVLLLGRVLSGRGGEALVESALAALHDEYPALAAAVSLHLPDEKSRRVGQSVAAASLPAL